MLLTDYNISSWIFSKTLSLCYFIAFLSLLPQLLGLYGRQGILSIDHLLNLLDKEMRAERFYHVPSVFWLASSDLALKAVCFIGMTAASLAFLGFSQSIMFLICFVCYLSFVSAGQLFLSYQWDSLLLEFGFLGLFFAPFAWEWLPLGAHILHPIVYFMVLFLLFKLMFLSGVVKLANKDPYWKDLSALSFHFWTQPLPTPLAYFVHKLPSGVLRFCTMAMFFIELVTPFFIFYPGPLQTAAVILLITLQILIILTGNYGFFNILTIGLCLGVLPDSTWGFKINWVENTPVSTVMALVPLILVVPSSLFWIAKSLAEKSKMWDFMLPYMRFFYPFRICNPYGLFAVMTRVRPELVLEGSNDGVHWETYEFKHKPTSLKKFPTIVAPHQPRLDWQMWFAALESFNENLWLQNLLTRIFEGSQDVLMLFEKDPFKGQPPKALRFLRYEYKFSSFAELRKDGVWWTRELIAPYGPVFQREEFTDDESSQKNAESL
ncbi:lipase maturation factor family protein [Bdellovibrio bacteriovorus]|uniref:lipase maturation factor family protein n=1 Tax=Bdellovibrio bacteriovorus TaxID=959 RepID=UPI0035A62E50